MNCSALVSARLLTRLVLRPAPVLIRLQLAAALLAACSGVRLPTAPDMPTFVPPGMIENPIVPGSEVTPSTGMPEPSVVANYHFDVVLDYAGHRVQVTEMVEVINPGPDVWTELVFFLPELQHRYHLYLNQLVHTMDELLYH